MPQVDLTDPGSAVNFVNVKNLGDAAGFAMGRIYNAAADGYAEIGMISRAAAAAAVRSLVQVDPIESVATNKLMTGNDTAAQAIAGAIAAAVAQQLAKTAQTTPPPTV